MDMIENQTFDELKPGETASLVRTLSSFAFIMQWSLVTRSPSPLLSPPRRRNGTMSPWTANVAINAARWL